MSSSLPYNPTSSQDWYPIIFTCPTHSQWEGIIQGVCTRGYILGIILEFCLPEFLMTFFLILILILSFSKIDALIFFLLYICLNIFPSFNFYLFCVFFVLSVSFVETPCCGSFLKIQSLNFDILFSELLLLQLYYIPSPTFSILAIYCYFLILCFCPPNLLFNG